MNRWRTVRGAVYAAAIVWINAYVCRSWFFNPTALTNSLHGYQAAIARLAGQSSWLQAGWWPFWDAGIPFEFTGPPLIPALAASIAAVQGIPHLMALQSVSALIYCAAPLALFLMAWGLTRTPEYSFFAALFYSLLCPVQLLVPQGPFSWDKFLQPHRFMLQAVWNETPRCAALAFLLLYVLFLARWLERRRPAYCAAAAVSLALAMLATPFALPSAAMATLCLLAVLEVERRRANILRAAAIAGLAFAFCARFLPPSLWAALAASSAATEPWHPGLFAALSACVLLWVTVLHFLQRWKVAWPVAFFALLTLAVSCPPLIAARWPGRQFLPQPGRFRIEMEAAIALLAIFGLRPLLDRLPRPARTVLAVLALAGAAQQVIYHRQLAKAELYPVDIRRTTEYRVAQRVAREFPGVRVMLPGSLALWANAFSETQQVCGSEGTLAYSRTQRLAERAIYEGAGTSAAGDARVSLAWLKAYGAAAVFVPSPTSGEFWKPFLHPDEFSGWLPELWTEDGIAAYRVPQRTASLAHIVPESALVLRAPAYPADLTALDRYNAALDDPAAPEASFAWLGRNRIRVAAATTAPGQAISIQVNYHPGWHGAVNGRSADVHRDGLGFLWLRAGSPGPATIELDYDGGWEFRLCRWASGLALLGTVAWCVRGGRR